MWFYRAGTNDREGLPGLLGADLGASPASSAAWVAAADRLEAQKYMNVLGALRGSEVGPEVLRVLGHEAHDPWLRLAPTIHGLRDELLGCHEAKGVSSVQARWTISPAGKPSRVEVTPKTVASGASGEEVAACIARVLERSAWPCTRSAKPEPVEVRLCVGR